jgi:hypothetical protein
MKRRAQISQVFFYIMAIIVFSVILIFGYRTITDFIEKGEQVAFITFKTDLESAVRKVASDFGSVTVYNTRHPLLVPNNHQRICFINVDRTPPVDCDSTLNPIICDAWLTSFNSGGWGAAESNVFLEPLGKISIKVYRITLDTNSNGVEDSADAGYLCLSTSEGRVDIRLEGRGDHTLVSAS